MGTDPNYGPHSPYGGCDGCLGSIIVNSSTVYTKTNDYYMIGHFSRFIRRGSVIHRVTNGTMGTNGDSNQFLILAAHNPDQSWAVVFMNNLNSTQNVRLSFSQAGHTWEGVIPNSTVVTWLIPSDQMVEKYPPQAFSSISVDTTRSASSKQTPVYTNPLPYGYLQETTARSYGHITTAASTFSCPATTTSSSSSSTSSSTSTRTYASVPYTTHVIPENEL
jgi:glucosylceramidase